MPTAPMRGSNELNVRAPNSGAVASLRQPRHPSSARRMALEQYAAFADSIRLVVKTQGGVALLPIREVESLEADGNVVIVHTGTGDRHRIRESLSNLFEQLSGHGFIRVHRGAVLRANAITAIEKGRYRKAFAVLRSGAKFEIGRVEFQRLRALWQPGVLDLQQLSSRVHLLPADD